jgi:hypothetical protein
MTVLSCGVHFQFTLRRFNASLSPQNLDNEMNLVWKTKVQKLEQQAPFLSENEARVSSPNTEPPHLAAILALIAVSIFVIALSGMPNLMDNEQRVAAYVLDAVQNGNWICQRDTTGDIASKPPMYTWIAALATLPFERINRFSLYLPSALATLAVSLIIFRVGRAQFGWQSGFLAAMAYLLSPLADRQVTLPRYDGLFTVPVALGAMAAFQAWLSGRGWTWFWLWAAVATMVKGPLGIVLAAGGLLAVWWEKRSGTPLRIRGPHWAGIGLFLLICGGWFLLAYRELGDALLAKMVGKELVGHAVGSDTTNFPLAGFYEPAYSFVRFFAPWSVIACLGFWRVWRRPSPDEQTRRFERFLFCWFFVGLLIFSVAAHQRGRLIFPLIPAAALLAGRELAHWVTLWSPERIRRTALAATAVFLMGTGLYHHVLLRRSTKVQETIGMRDLAGELRRRLGDEFPLYHVDSPFALQFYLNTARRQISTARAAELLSGGAPAVVTVRDFVKLRNELPPQIVLHQIAGWPASKEATVRVVSNVPRPESNRTIYERPTFP